MTLAFEIITAEKVDGIALFTFSQEREEKQQKIVSMFCDSDETIVVFYDDELHLGKTLEVRGDGIWSDAIEEVKGEHWSLSMESFALRMSHDEFKSQTLHQNLIGERIPYGYDLDCTSENGNEWVLSGNIIVGKTEYSIETELCEVFRS